MRLPHRNGDTANGASPNGMRDKRGEMTTVDVVSEVVIARPRSEVAAYCSEPDNATAWYVNIKSVQWESARPMGVGSRFAFAARFLGRPLSYTYEVVDLQPGARFVMRTAQGPFPM